MKKNSDIQKIIRQIYKSKAFRTELANKDIFWFFSIYFSHYIQYESAEFQKEIFKLVSNETIPIVVITSFRGSAKSTICTLVLPIWAIVGRWQKKYVVIVCQTQPRARDALANIRAELEMMGVLVEDYQPREGKTDKWNENSIIIPKYGAKITAISIGESIRGIRHKQYRPDLVISDDLEDVPSCKSAENREKVWEFVNGELIPAGDKNTKYVFIGNKVHNDSLIMKLKDAIGSKKMKGVYKEYPLINEKGKIVWSGKYPDMKAIEKLKVTYASEIDFLREQMLMILPDGDAIVKPNEINYYDKLPEQKPEFFFISVDPAFSEKSTGDYTAIVSGAVYRIYNKLKVYINKNPINKRMKVDETIEEIKNIKISFGQYALTRIFVEGGSAQKGLIDMLRHEGVNAEEITPGGQDKASRLHTSSPWIKNGVILFPRTGVETLKNQILFFGTEKYDDLVDALTLLVLALLKIEENIGCMPISIKSNWPWRKGIVLEDDT